MSNENKTIHDFELSLICDFFSNMERQGPGSPEATLKALSFAFCHAYGKSLPSYWQKLVSSFLVKYHQRGFVLSNYSLFLR